MRYIEHAEFFLITLYVGVLGLACVQSGCSSSGTEKTLEVQTAPQIKGSDTSDIAVKVPVKTAEQKTDTAYFLRFDSLPGHILKLLSVNNMPAISSHVHPTYPLCISPYAYVDSIHIRCIPKTEIPSLIRPGANRMLWGSMDGTGDPIRMTWAEYRKRFVWDKNYLSDSVKFFTSPKKGRGNSYFNIPEQFPHAAVAEYHVMGRERYAWMDWSSLYLVFIHREGRWWLRAIVHDQWTI